MIMDGHGHWQQIAFVCKFVGAMCAKCFHQIFPFEIRVQNMLPMLLCMVYAHRRIAHEPHVDVDSNHCGCGRQMSMRYVLHHFLLVSFALCTYFVPAFLVQNWKYRLQAQVCYRIYFTLSFCLQLFLLRIACWMCWLAVCTDTCNTHASNHG